MPNGPNNIILTLMFRFQEALVRRKAKVICYKTVTIMQPNWDSFINISQERRKIQLLLLLLLLYCCQFPSLLSSGSKALNPNLL